MADDGGSINNPPIDPTTMADEEEEAEERSVPQDPQSSSVVDSCPCTAKGRSLSPDGASSSPSRTALDSDKSKQRGHSLAEVKKSLARFSSDEERLEALITSQTALLDEKRLMAKTMKEHEKMYSALTKKMERKDQEHQKALLAKNKLEELCRELQKSNRVCKEENVQRLKQHELSRQEMVDKFKASLAEIQESMRAGKERSERLAEDNVQLSAKMKALAEQYEDRQDRAEQLVAAKGREVQLFDTQMHNVQSELLKISEERRTTETALMLKLKERDEELQEALVSRSAMREQIAKYTAKYDELQKNLASSNETFDRFKRELEKMNGALVAVERESRLWKAKCEEANKMLLELVAKKKDGDAALALKERQLEKLQKLCRGLQEERSEMQKALRCSQQ